MEQFIYDKMDNGKNKSKAAWKYEKIIEQIQYFEEQLDSEHEIAISLASFGRSITMSVEDIGYQDPDMLYFYGTVNDKEAQLIQHISQLNFLITSAVRKDKSKPAKRIGFDISENDE